MRLHRYDDAELKGLEISKKIQQVWASDRFTTVAEVTAEVHSIRAEVPRSAIFWLAYHQIHGAPANKQTAN
jgi:hypothetical protein|tara:strand:+ start:169 stop:381 length:213 start_codon:yes stop_codon:yes gene_type:complete